MTHKPMNLANAMAFYIVLILLRGTFIKLEEPEYMVLLGAK